MSTIGAATNKPGKVRFAPSPTGRMHAGNIFTALLNWLIAREEGMDILLRIEDLDRQRSKDFWADQLLRDLEYLGLTWDEGPYYQHDRDGAYEAAFEMLDLAGLVYPCYCTRAELSAASAPHLEERQVYPGTCRPPLQLDSSLLGSNPLGSSPSNLNPLDPNLLDSNPLSFNSLDPVNPKGDAQIKRYDPEIKANWRLITDHRVIEFNDGLQGPYSQILDRDCGDFVIRRKDGGFAYQLAVVVDDADEDISCVIRAYDLLSSTPQQIYLQDLLGLDHPSYIHTPLLVVDEDAHRRRLSKRDHDASLEELLRRYGSGEGIIGHLAFLARIIPTDEAVSPEDLLDVFGWDQFKSQVQDKRFILWQP